MADDEITKTFKNLEIIKSSTKNFQSFDSLNYNPFQKDSMQSSSNLNLIFGDKCDCSEMNNEVRKIGSSSMSQGLLHRKKVQQRHQHLENKYRLLDKNIKNHIFFKQKDKRSDLIKATLLKNFAKCVHNRIISVANDSKIIQEPSSASMSPVTHQFRIRAKSFGDADKCRNNYLDFRELIKQCSAIRIPTRNARIRMLKNKNKLESDSDSEDSDESNLKAANGFAKTCFTKSRISSNKDLTPIGGPPALEWKKSRRNSFSEEKTAQLTLNSPSNSSASSSNNSCSQQARMDLRSNTDDGWNIDEIASYFETFVYIPKKMSEMAEQMYT